MRFRKLALAAVSTAIMAGVASPAAGENLSPEARLRKMSLQLRGIVPHDSEFAQLRSLEGAAQAPFFLQKANAYVMSDLAADKLSDRLFEVLRFDLPETSLFLRDETYRKASQDGVDLARGFDRRMESLKDAITRQISAGKSWDEILTTSDILYLPMAGQALSEFSQISAELSSKIATLGQQGVPTASVQDKANALKMLAGEIPLPPNVSADVGYDFTKRDEFASALKYATAVLPRLRQWIKENPSLEIDEFDSVLKSTQRAMGEAEGLVTFMIEEGSYYLEDVANGVDPNDVEEGQELPKTSGKEFERAMCMVDAMRATRQLGRRFDDVDCKGLSFASPLLTPDVVAWLLQLDLSQPGQTSAAVDYLVKSSKTPAALEAILGSTDAKEIFSIPSIVSTQEFRDRYKKTRYSRAAAFFRTYFCDDMQPVIFIDNSTKTAEALKGLKEIIFEDPASAKAHEDVMKMITPDVSPNAMKPDGSKSAAEIASESSGSAHFKPECVACHRKLDPAEELIAGKSNFGAKTVEVVYDDADGNEVRVPIKDFSELNQIVVKQEQYVRCQSERLWAWTIGEDVSLDADRRAQLTKLYADTGAQPRQIMAALVTRPEFTSDESFTQPPTFSTVSSLLNRCNSCHAKEEDVPSFTSLPIEDEDHVRWLTKIAKSVNVGNKGVNAKMPKKGANWTLTEADRLALGRWIWNGARNDQGEPTISDGDRMKILKGASEEFIAAISQAREPVTSFRPTWRRYLENYDLLNVLAQKFPSSYASCASKVDRKMQGALGFKDKNSGMPTSLTPGVAMVDWLNNCFIKISQETVKKIDQGAPLHAIERSLLVEELAAAPKGTLSGTAWASVDVAVRVKTVSNLIDRLVGPMILAADERADLETTVKETLGEVESEKRGNYSVAEALSDAIFTILNDERFLTY